MQIKRCRRCDKAGEFPAQQQRYDGVAVCGTLCLECASQVPQGVFVRKPHSGCCPLLGRQCVRCREVKTLDGFPSRLGRPNNTCRSCDSTYVKKGPHIYSRQTEEQRREYRRQYEQSDRGKAARQRVVLKLKQSGWRKAHDRRKALLRNYNLTEAAFLDLLTSQGNLCAICRQPNPSKRYTWHVDHDHATGKARGVLCVNCNVGLGKFADDINRLSRALEYLDKYERVLAA